MKKTRGKVTYTQLQNGEQMKPIEGYPDYFVTTFGRILSVRPMGAATEKSGLREITLSFGGEKYYYCNIYNDKGVRCSLRVHRLVYQHWNTIGDSLKEGFVIDHIDENKLNNNINNLQQITISENSLKHHKFKKQPSNVWEGIFYNKTE